ncbi:WecB/TagA/CpsF family glycosyltransferase [Aquibacillus salsiterrae]|uniref:N-acetylglucosaminyldiphosphoundecaprenol N-acetyl-beta-D-mannosaminyltransferase n=1 Tax=Aquibacillus salsiterrae TaxID=2950439 RepID=A0A9X4AG36_9BACI|nr:WecB/TagA/CpsF family glycosyltransferase [Aquibacillus salsiterrae]MDC3416693.1 WecB/TagA/CpsF family glycosyltransferase [Aquibacillus salsiterrae]
MTQQKETILGVNVSDETYTTIAKKLFLAIEEKKQSFIVAVNPEKIIKASKDPELKELINSADYQIPDGVGVLIASKLQGGNISNRITGIDLMNTLIGVAAKQQKRIFLYGGKPGVAEAAKQKLIQMYPDLKVAGVIDGYQKDNQLIIDTINAAKADLLFVAMGSPRQEEWIRANRDKLDVSVFQGVGGSFDVVAGNIKRAPASFRKLGLEWLYRLMIEPWRMKRQLALPLFLVEVFKQKNK